MIRVCNWNRAHAEDLVMGRAEPYEDGSLTHGICEGCRRAIEQDQRKEKEVPMTIPMCSTCGERVATTAPDLWIGRGCLVPNCGGRYLPQDEAKREMESGPRLYGEGKGA